MLIVCKPLFPTTLVGGHLRDFRFKRGVPDKRLIALGTQISDFGLGILVRLLDLSELIFQRFWRRDRNQQGSTGLGLSIVQRIVELHGASIAVENRVLGGAQFSLHFIAADKPG